MRRLASAIAIIACLASAAPAESVYFPGGHFWATGMDRDIMAWHTGWVTEFNTVDHVPDLAHYNDITGEGFTIIQRLDYVNGETVPYDPEDYPVFAALCAKYANRIKNYCHIYTIGNEVDLTDVSSSEYADCFEQVRDAIKLVQPEAKVIIGHWCDSGRTKAVALKLGPGNYEGCTAHNNGVPWGMLQAMDEAGAPPEAGVYITEWGWVVGTNPSAQSDIQRFFNDVAAWNANNQRQVYGKTWFVYYSPDWHSFSLKLSPIDNAAFEYGITHTQPCNRLIQNQIHISNVRIETNSDTQVTVTWQTDIPSTTQAWYSEEGAPSGGSTALDVTPTTDHTAVMGGLSAYSRYQVVARSTGIDVGDAADGPHPFVSGMALAVEPYRIADGWNMIAVPLAPLDPEASAVFADQIAAGNGLTGAMHRYEPGAGYETYPYAFTEMELGRGYWLYLSAAVNNTAYGSKSWDPVNVPLHDGWNLIGHVSTNSINWFGAVQVTDGGTTLGIEAAHAAGWLDKTGYYYEDGYKALGEQYVADDYKLRQWRAYWVVAMRPGLELVIPTH